MKILWNNGWFTLPVLVFFCVGLWVKFNVPYGHEILWFNQWREEPINTFFRWATQLGEYPAFLAAIVGTAFWQRRVALLIALMGLLLLPMQYVIKDLFGVDRPITYFQEVGMRDYVVLVPRETLNKGKTSFPSGHTAGAFALYTFLTLALGRRMPVLGLAFASAAILTGISRIFLVQHFLPDVLAGAIIGILTALLFWVMRRGIPLLSNAAENLPNSREPVELP